MSRLVSWKFKIPVEFVAYDDTVVQDDTVGRKTPCNTMDLFFTSLLETHTLKAKFAHQFEKTYLHL